MECYRLVTLTGPGGVGKTRLAIAIAERIESGFPDGICFVDLAPITQAEGVPLAIGGALGIQEEALSPVSQTIGTYVAGRHLLLILDNCEHLVEACAAFAQSVLEASPQLRILTTSRRPLGIPGEHILRIPPLGVPECHTRHGKDVLAQVMASDAARLFMERVGEANPGFHCTPAQASVIGEICRLLEGMPLALELTAAGTRSLPLSEIAARLRNSLEAGLVEVPLRDGRHRSLHAALDWSCRLLRSEELRFLCRLCVFAGSFSLEAAAFVGGEAVHPPGNGLSLLAQLVDHSLILREPGPFEGRYRLLETTRQHLLAKLAECKEETRTRERHLAFYLDYAERTAPELMGPKQAILLKQLECEQANLRAALEFSRTSPDRAIQGLRLAIALWRFWAFHGYLSEGRKYLQEFLAVAQSSQNLCLRARALLGSGNLALLQGDYPDAQRQFREAEEIARSVGEPAVLAGALQGLGNAAHEENRNEDAQRFQEQSLALWRELGDERAIAIVLNNLGNIAKEQRQLDRARALYDQSLALHRKTGNLRGAATTTLCLGIVAAYGGNLQETVRLCEESLRAYRELGDRRGMVFACSNLAGALRDLGRRTEAELVLEEAMDTARDLDHRTLLAECLVLKARFAREEADADTARHSLVEALALVRPSTDPRIQTWCLLHAALAAADWGYHEGLAVLWGALQRLPENQLWQPDEHPPPGMPSAERRVRDVLGEEAFCAAAHRGSSMTRQDAMEYALKLLRAGPGDIFGHIFG
jgi:predicted ATPase